MSFDKKAPALLIRLITDSHGLIAGLAYKLPAFAAQRILGQKPRVAVPLIHFDAYADVELTEEQLPEALAG